MASITNFILNGISASGHNIYVATSGFSPSFLSVGGRRYNGLYNTTAAFIVDMYLLTRGLGPSIKNFSKSYSLFFVKAILTMLEMQFTNNYKTSLDCHYIITQSLQSKSIQLVLVTVH